MNIKNKFDETIIIAKRRTRKIKEKTKKQKNWKIKVSIVVSILLFFIFIYAPLFIPKKIINQEPIIYTVEEGSITTTVAEDLKSHKIIKSKTAFNFWYKIFQGDLYVQTYELSSNMSLFQIILTLNTPETNMEQAKVTIIEGSTIIDIAAELEKTTGIDESQFLNLWSNPDFLNKVIDEYESITDEILNEDIKYPLEGYLYPDTYFISPGDTPEKITYMILDQTEKIYNEYKIYIDKSEYTFHQILTIASIIQMESSSPEDMKMIAQVFYNRIEEGMSLQSDTTINYITGIYEFHVSIEQTNIEDPYNTYMNVGLPPGPIANPGQNAIDAALNPTENNYLYFLSDIEGNTYYAETYEEHIVNKEKYVDIIE